MDQRNITVTQQPNVQHTNSDPNTNANMNIMLPEVTKAEAIVVGGEPAGSESAATPVAVPVTVAVAGGSEPVVKRGRGRPRKYEANRGVMSPTSVPPPPRFSAPFTVESPVVKRSRGRPRGSGKLQILASIGGYVAETAGGSFTPHVMTVNVGEDVVSKILTFFHKGPRSVCILSANGPVSTVVIRQPGVAGDTLKYEGRFEILSLSGSCTYTTGSDGKNHKEGMLTVSLAKPDGRVFGGSIDNSLIAAGPIQLVMGTFTQHITKQMKRKLSSQSSDAPNVLYDQDPDRSVTIATPAPVPNPNPNPAPNDVPERVTIAATPAINGIADSVIPATTTAPTNGVSHNVIAEDLNMHSSASVDDGADLNKKDLAQVDTTVPQI